MQHSTRRMDTPPDTCAPAKPKHPIPSERERRTQPCGNDDAACRPNSVRAVPPTAAVKYKSILVSVVSEFARRHAHKERSKSTRSWGKQNPAAVRTRSENQRFGDVKVQSIYPKERGRTGRKGNKRAQAGRATNCPLIASTAENAFLTLTVAITAAAH